jgi:hypothetical protein
MTTNSSPEPDSTQAFVRMAALTAAVAVVLGLAGYYPTIALCGSEGVRALVIGMGVALVGAWLGSLMPALFISPDPRVFLNGLLLGLGVRFAVTLALALLLRALDVAPEKPLLLWVGLGQVVLLGSDSVAQVRLARRLTWGNK